MCRMVFLSHITFLAMALNAVAHEQNACEKKYAKLVLTEMDKRVIVQLNQLSNDRQEFLTNVCVLLAIAEVAEAPKTVDGLAEKLANGTFAARDEQEFAKIAKGLKQLSAKPSWEALTLILAGKAHLVHQDLRGYRPTGEFRRLLQCLEGQYRLLAQG